MRPAHDGLPLPLHALRLLDAVLFEIRNDRNYAALVEAVHDALMLKEARP